MKDITKYQGVIPAFYACYDAEGNISTEEMAEMTYQVDVMGRTVDDVAQEFLVSKGLLAG